MSKTGRSKLSSQQMADQRRLAALLKDAPAGIRADVARDLDVTPGAISQLVSGHRPLNISAAAAFASRLRVTLDQISPSLTEEGFRIAATLPGSVAHTPAADEMEPFGVSTTEWATVSESMRSQLVALIRAAVKDARESVPGGRRQRRSKSQ